MVCQNASIYNLYRGIKLVCRMLLIGRTCIAVEIISFCRSPGGKTSGWGLGRRL